VGVFSHKFGLRPLPLVASLLAARMKLSGSTFALLTALLPCAVGWGAAPESPDYAQSNAAFATTAARQPADARAQAPAVVRPAPAEPHVLAKPSAPGLGRVAPAAAAVVQPGAVREFPTGQPTPRAVAIVAPGTQAPVHFWHWPAGARASTVPSSRGPLFHGRVYRAGGGAVSHGVAASAGLNRFVPNRSTSLTTPVRPGTAPSESR
jgi:hypothetical protein